MSYCNEHFAEPSIKWIGFFATDIAKFGIQSKPLSVRDNQKLKSLFTRPCIDNKLYRELKVIEEIQRKSEIEEMADSSCTYLIDVYLKHKIDNIELAI